MACSQQSVKAGSADYYTGKITRNNLRTMMHYDTLEKHRSENYNVQFAEVLVVSEFLRDALFVIAQ